MGSNYSFAQATFSLLLLGITPIFPAHATLLLEESFDYPAGGLVANSGGVWAMHGGFLPGQVVVLDTASDNGESLEYAGAPAPQGRRVQIDEFYAEDVSRVFTPITGQDSVVYTSVLVKCTSIPSGSGDFFFHFMLNVNKKPHGRVYVRPDGSGGVNFGFRVQYSDPTQYASENCALNVTHLLIMKYTIQPGGGFDRVDMWLNPTPGVSEGPPDATGFAVSGEGTNSMGIDAIGLRENLGFGDGHGVEQIDEIRVATTYEEVNPGNSSIDDWMMWE